MEILTFFAYYKVKSFLQNFIKYDLISKSGLGSV